jgi:hypothetical protein
LDKELEKLIAAAKKVQISADDRAEQRISFAFGNLPEEYFSSSKESVKKADNIMRSKQGWDGTLNSPKAASRPRSAAVK